MSRHVMEILGHSRVVVEDGEIKEVSEPKVRYCPLFKKYRNIDEITCDTVRKNVEFRMKDFGMFTEERQTTMNAFVTFGISEILSLAISNGIIDAAVIAADGCGTFVSDRPGLIQGMGGRISGLVETSPIKKVIDDIGTENVLDPETAVLDQCAGVEKAFTMGYRKVAVTTPFPEDAEKLRERYGDAIVICAVHTTCLDKDRARRICKVSDIVTACANKTIREVGSEKALIQAGTAVPVYGFTEIGKRMMSAKMEELGKTPDHGLTDNPDPLIR